MIGDITLGQLYPGNSLLHRMDPRFKILFTVLFLVMLFCSDTLAGVLISLTFVLAIYLVARIPLSMLFKSLKPVLPIILLMLLFNIFFYSGKTVLFQWGFFKLTAEGLKMSGLMIFRIVAIIAGTAMLTYTTSSIELTDALESLFSPLKRLHFPVSELAMMMSIALRFIPTLIEETQKIMAAQKARGADFESGNLIARARALLPILIPLFVSAIKRAGELATAMESRCYHNGEGRTRLKQLKSAPRDYVSLSVMLLLCAAVITARYISPKIF